MLPVILVTAEVNNKKHNKGQYKGHKYISCNIGSPRKDRQQTKHIVYPDKEKQCQQQRHVSAIFIANIWNCYIVAYKKYDRLNKRLKAFWGLSFTLFISGGYRREYQYKQDNGNPYRCDIFCD